MLFKQVQTIDCTLAFVMANKEFIEMGKLKPDEVDVNSVLNLLGICLGYGETDSRQNDQYNDISENLQTGIQSNDGKMVVNALSSAKDLLLAKRGELLIKYAFKENARKAFENYKHRSDGKEKPFQGKGVIYTVITGGYDELNEPEYVDADFDYICFTDTPNMKSDVWKIVKIENPDGLDGTRLARKHKVLCHQYLSQYDYSIYVDGKLEIVGDFKKYIAEYSSGNTMLCFPHHVRDCIYAEANECIKLQKDNSEIINEQMQNYRNEGYPEHNGMIDSACLIRSHHDEKLKKVLECWWNEIKNHSRRDQLSFGYACWKNEYYYDISALYIYENEYIVKKRTWEINL